MSGKLIAGVAAALVLIAAVLGIHEISGNDTGDARSQARPNMELSKLPWIKDVKPSAASPGTNAPLPRPVNAPNANAMHATSKAVNGMTDRRDPPTDGTSTSRTGAEDSRGARSGGTAPSKSGVSDPTAVIGRPFKISPSVQAGCKEVTCPELEADLAKFAQQPRDPAWASEMEARLEDYIENSEPNKYQIRNIECRTSMCYVEVASIYGQLFPPGYNSPMRQWLFTAGSDFGYEVDPSSARITVTVLPFFRR
jgi:hypothetical protein